MKRLISILALLIAAISGVAQEKFTGRITDSITSAPIVGATITLSPGKIITSSDETGSFFFKLVSGKKYSVVISAIGYDSRALTVSDFGSMINIVLNEKMSQLSEVVITPDVKNPNKFISETDIRFRGVSNSQEVLRLVPGLFISQHQGGGKAEQIFLRGFDNDHGRDIALYSDGMPINLVSHAHGQGYADSHFIIPETIDRTSYEKGVYNAEKGDLAVSGAVDYHTADVIDKSQFKVEVGQFDTYRIFGIVDLLGKKNSINENSWYAASEYRYSNSYFENPQHFKRFNFFSKLRNKLGEKNYLSISSSYLNSDWKASGQIPENAVNSGALDYFGAVDPNEGGATSRANLNIQLLSKTAGEDRIKNQLYYTYYKFDLHSNFSLFLTDTLNGDEIRQRESRNLVGYNGSYRHQGSIGSLKTTIEAGINFRLDATHNTQMEHTVNRYTTLGILKLGDITESSYSAYFAQTFHFSPKITMRAGVRYDRFFFLYKNKLSSDSTFEGVGAYRSKDRIISPKVNFYYTINDRSQIYLFLGKGFNSNDTRSVVASKGLPTLPAAYGIDLGTVLKPMRNFLLNAVLWYSYLQQEYVYGGDGGTIDFSGRSRRLGIDISARYQPISALYFDVDVNFANGRSLDSAPGENYIPLAPIWSSSGGMTCVLKSGLNGSVRFRYLSDRPADETYSLIARGYFINDLVLNYTKKRYEVGLTINNLLGVRWKESQFQEETRLRGGPIDNGITFTPGTKFSALLHLSYFFR
ncbi:TonB-dependent receptor [Pedobacter jamesrossensis]|uniref:TonB-dependent receptor n=1 Tax=Pedobacter jamesrossensis TaxID=1908238 RepID=A0ABV8NLY7_9SPHI